VSEWRGGALIGPDKKIGGLLLHIQASIMRRKACDALCISHVYQYNGKVSKNIQNSVKFSTNFFTSIPLLAVLMRQGDIPNS
jgi:hypothetical protein